MLYFFPFSALPRGNRVAPAACAVPESAELSGLAALDDLVETVTNALVGENQLQRSLAQSANAHSESYRRQQSAVIQSFMESIEENPELARAAMLMEDPENPGLEQPRFVLAFRNKPATNQKSLRAFNKLLVNFFYKLKKLDGTQFAASSWSTRLKTLLSSLKRLYGFCFVASDFK